MAITMPSTQPKSAYQMILDWAPMRPLWQQDALRRIVAKGKLDSSDIDELVSLCLKGRGKAGIALDPIPLSNQDRLVRTTAGGTITLLSISDVRNANRLASDQILAFAPSGLTIVYGDNGVGKSGYARILKRACRARFTTEIMPNAFDVAAVKGATATISYADEGRAMPPIAWTDDRTPNHILSAVSVFDRESGAVHVRDHNEVAFRPFGLDIPDELANACSLIKEKLTTEQTRLNSARDPIFNHPTFSTSTPVGKILANLTADIDITPLKALAELSSEDNDRLQRLSEDLARDPLKAAAEQRALAKSLVRFASDLENVLKANADQELLALLGAAQDARTKRTTAKLAATAIFSGAVLQGVGEEAWRHLWEAARRYSEQFAYSGQSFPITAEDTACVLCQQPLGEDARNRFITFETFVTDDTEREAREAEAQLSLLHADILGKPIRIAAFPLRRQLVVIAPDVARAVLRCLAAARLRRAICLNAVVSGNTTSLPAEAPSPIQGLRELAAKVESYADELTAAANAAGRKRLEEERDALRDRKSLKVLLPKAEAEITRLSDLARISLCLTEVNTKAITALGNKIADEIITPRVRDRFQEEIQKLAATRVRVDIVRSGGKFGSPHYQVRLFANEQAKVHLVLSEGEQTCVALAVFLTELATASFASTLVFDDPVSSLDHRWRQKVAERLVDEAKIRQIVVFTHDLVFLNDLQTLATRASVSHKEVFLNQSIAGTGIVNDGLPWVGQRLPQRLDALEKEARAAKALFDIQDDEGYAAAVAKFYNRLRSTWERALEDVAFCNVIHRHRDYINAKDLKKVAVLEPADVVAWEAGFKICCDITDAHDPSRGRNAASPPPADLIKHVQDLTSWVESLRERHKQIA